MCFIIHKNHTDLKVAEEDIPCYKILADFGNNILKSPHMYEIYEPNKLKKVEIDIPKLSLISMSLEINKGLHSFSIRDKADQVAFFGGITFKAIIPKGSKYYYNPDRSEYVSDQLIVLEEIKRVVISHCTVNTV